MTTIEKTTTFIKIQDARALVQIGDVLQCELTRTFDGVGVFANAYIEKEDEIYSVGGLFKGFFGEAGTSVWGEVSRFDSKGKIGFVLCEAPHVAPVLEEEEIACTEEQPTNFEFELEKAKAEMRREFEVKLKEAEARMKKEAIKEELHHVVKEIAKITGVVSPKAVALLEEMFDDVPATEIGKLVGIVAQNHDSSLHFVKDMQKTRGCL